MRRLKLAESLSRSHTSEGCEVLGATWVTAEGRGAPCSGQLVSWAPRLTVRGKVLALPPHSRLPSSPGCVYRQWELAPRAPERKPLTVLSARVLRQLRPRSWTTATNLQQNIHFRNTLLKVVLSFLLSKGKG